jgi:N-acetyl-gamma-glutamyl-phosphate reductase
MKKIFIDGSVGTTGLRIAERLAGRKDLQILSLTEEKRKDAAARKEMLNTADISFLCLPDDAAREAVSFVENPNAVIIDASTAHRTLPNWAYGFPELGKEFLDKLEQSKRIAVPGCHASGFIALVYPLIKNGILGKDALLSAHSLTGYSGGGKKMIADYESEGRDTLLNSPRQYGVSQNHKHLPEMVKITGIDTAPIFSPIVGDFYSGMQVTVPLFSSMLKYGNIDTVKEIYADLYNGNIVKYTDKGDENGFLSTTKLGGKDGMQIEVYGNADRIILVARYDNLGKGASGAAIECMNIKLGVDPTTGLIL